MAPPPQYINILSKIHVPIWDNKVQSQKRKDSMRISFLAIAPSDEVWKTGKTLNSRTDT